MSVNMASHEFLISDEFKDYQKRLLKLFAETIYTQMIGKEFAEAKGVRDIAIKVLDLPTKLYPKSDELKNKKKEAIKEFQVEFIK